MKENKNSCENCNQEIKDDSDYCPRCGAIFINDVFCIAHTDVEATGVCVICTEPYCNICGNIHKKVFLCKSHLKYEIYESMAKVFGTSDEVEIQHLKSILEESGLHPFIYSRKSSPMHLGGTDYSLFRASGDFNGHLINEIKLMLPFSEVMDAEKMILEINNNNN